MLRIGMRVREVDSVLAIQPNRIVTLSRLPEYDVHIYPLVVDVVRKNALSLNRMVLPLYMTSTIVDSLYLIFRQGQLRYWGSMSDLQKSEDHEIHVLAPILHAQIPIAE